MLNNERQRRKREGGCWVLEEQGLGGAARLQMADSRSQKEEFRSQKSKTNVSGEHLSRIRRLKNYVPSYSVAFKVVKSQGEMKKTAQPSVSPKCMQKRPSVILNPPFFGG